MKLSPPPLRGRRISTASSNPRALTTEPGFTNPNNQVVVATTGAPSTTRDGQGIYRLRCRHCDGQYGCNGLDIKGRLCPMCQGGAPGEPLRDPAPSLFD